MLALDDLLVGVFQSGQKGGARSGVQLGQYPVVERGVLEAGDLALRIVDIAKDVLCSLRR